MIYPSTYALCRIQPPEEIDKNVKAVDKAPLAKADTIVYL